MPPLAAAIVRLVYPRRPQIDQRYGTYGKRKVRVLFDGINRNAIELFAIYVGKSD